MGHGSHLYQPLAQHEAVSTKVCQQGLRGYPPAELHTQERAIYQGSPHFQKGLM